jgi:hypothetical protein
VGAAALVVKIWARGKWHAARTSVVQQTGNGPGSMLGPGRQPVGQAQHDPFSSAQLDLIVVPFSRHGPQY